MILIDPMPPFYPLNLITLAIMERKMKKMEKEKNDKVNNNVRKPSKR